MKLCVLAVSKELVTFSSQPLLESPAISNAGRHLSAAEFHSVLHGAGNNLESEGQSGGKPVILLDARNVYETRIGKFETSNVETLDPEIRKYSDLPSWINSHAEQLQGKSVLMYCTGGIRCEMASTYIRSKGHGFENVLQVGIAGAVGYKEASGAGQDEVAAAGGLVGVGCSSV
ncbi:rhodanese-like domain-containing protein 6 [Papaver somniferum]|uniref:rhodanese-like domain-containing protein 6 n=1 Tax=Papaver somniferum TaxID=3469 RepID=UPI000E6F535D|nr:rhodanese-like domain-containing protein 6 [Papaver somniferum]